MREGIPAEVCKLCWRNSTVELAAQHTIHASMYFTKKEKHFWGTKILNSTL